MFLVMTLIVCCHQSTYLYIINSIKQTAKTFIKLDMDQKVFVTNEESKKILDEERVAIYVSNRNRDTHMDYSEFWGTGMSSY